MENNKKLLLITLNVVLVLYLVTRALFIITDYLSDNVTMIYQSSELIITYITYVMLCVIFLTLGIALAVKNQSSFNIKLLYDIDLRWLNFNPILIALIILIIIYITEIIIIMTGYINPFYGFINISNRTYPSIYVTTFWQMQVLATHAFCFWGIINYKKLSKISLTLLVTLFLFLVFMEFFIAAARRFIVPVIIFSFFYFELYKKKLCIYSLLSLILLFTFMPVVRESIFLGHNLNINILNWLIPVLRVNEFTAVGDGVFTTIDHIDFHNAYQYGQTYLNSFTQFIPRYFWTDKPLGITHITGAAISVYTEAYINFWFFGCIFVGMYFYFVNRLLLSGGIVAYYITAYSFDLGRSDLPSIFLYTIFHIIAYNCLNANCVKSKILWKKIND